MSDPQKKLCPLGHVKTQRQNGKHYCRECDYRRRADIQAPGRVARGLPAYPERKPAVFVPQTVCKLGHKKVQRSTGEWVCNVCHNMHRERRDAEARVLRGLPPEPKRHVKAPPANKLCKRGHQKVITPAGAHVCRVCRADWRRGVNALMRSGSCLHVGEEGFDGVLSTTGVVVCMTCLTESLTAAKNTGGAL
jgi:hypothetical protein